jgi:exodeoxyribonuclease VII large subunit
MAVLLRGRVDVYETRGEYQMLVDWLEPQGDGALRIAFEQLKQRLESEGLFAAARKRPLPAFPQRIGIVTSRSGAVIRDMLHILDRRFPGLHIRLYPALVQGDGSVEAVVDGIEYFGRSGWPDVILVGRGGGSLEDLWTFNTEAVARAIAACPVPVVSAVGHETDFTIADFVADLRAPTPSAAAELVVPDRSGVLAMIEGHCRHLDRAIHLQLARRLSRLRDRGMDRAEAILTRRLARCAQRMDDLSSAARRRWSLIAGNLGRRTAGLDARLRQCDPRARLTSHRRRLAELDARLMQASPLPMIGGHYRTVASQAHALRHAIAGNLRRQDARLGRAAAALDQLSPLRILARGYSIVENGRGRIIRDSGEVSIGEALRIRLANGRIGVRVENQN